MYSTTCFGAWTCYTIILEDQNHFSCDICTYTYCQFIFLFTYDTCSCSCILLIGLKTMESVALNDVVVVEVVGVIVVFVTIDVGRQASAFNAGRVSNLE